MSLPPEKILLRWMNFQLKKGGYSKTVTNFSSDVKVNADVRCVKILQFSAFVVLSYCNIFLPGNLPIAA